MFRWLKKKSDRRPTPPVSKSSVTKNEYNNRFRRNTDPGLGTSIAESIDNNYKEFENNVICATPSLSDKTNRDFDVTDTQTDKISYMITPANEQTKSSSSLGYQSVTKSTKATHPLRCTTAKEHNIKRNKKCRRWLTKHFMKQTVSVPSVESSIMPCASSKYPRTNKPGYFNHTSSGSQTIKQDGHPSGRTKEIYPYLCWSNCTNENDTIWQYTMKSSPSSSSLSSSSSEGTSGFYDQDIVYPDSTSCNGSQTPCKTRQCTSSLSSDSLFSSDSYSSNTIFIEKTYASSEHSTQREIMYEFNPRIGFGMNRWYRPQ